MARAVVAGEGADQRAWPIIGSEERHGVDGYVVQTEAGPVWWMKRPGLRTISLGKVPPKALLPRKGQFNTKKSRKAKRW